MFLAFQQCMGLLMCAQQWEHAVLHVVKSVSKLVTDSLGEALLWIDPHGFIDVVRDQRHWSNKHRSTTGCSSLLWTEVNTAGSRRCPRALRVNMKAYFRESAANASFINFIFYD